MYTERVVFPAEGKTYTVRGLNNVAELALLSELSRERGHLNRAALVMHTLERGVLEPNLEDGGALTLMQTYPEHAAELMIRIVALTTETGR